MSFYRTDDNAAAAVFDSNPGGSWVPITEAEYESLTATFPNPIRDDIAAFLSGAGITDPDAVAALYRLFGQTQ